VRGPHTTGGHGHEMGTLVSLSVVLPSPYRQLVCYVHVHTHTLFIINLRQPSHHLTLQAWQIFSTWFILGTLPRDHSIPTGLGNHLASDYLTTVPQPKPIQACPSSCESTSLLTTTIVVCIIHGHCTAPHMPLMGKNRYTHTVRTCMNCMSCMRALSKPCLHFLSSICCKVARFNPRLFPLPVHEPSTRVVLNVQAFRSLQVGPC
jgi:hypothetical protein